jgi:hypothetical protein
VSQTEVPAAANNCWDLSREETGPSKKNRSWIANIIMSDADCGNLLEESFLAVQEHSVEAPRTN